MAEQRVTLREIAEQANVSVAAVSYALHGKGRMSADTRSQLEQMLKDAGYKPSYKLRPLLYINSHHAFRDMHSLPPLLAKYEGINACCHSEDIPLRLELLDLPGASERGEQLEQMMSYRPSGVLLDDDLGDGTEEVARFFKRQDVAVIQLGHVPHTDLIDSVTVDNFGGAYAATRHLISQGHTRIATIRWNIEGDPASRQKYAGFCCAMDEAGLAVPEGYAVESPIGKTETSQPGRVAAEELLALPEPPTAVFVENSFISPSLIYPMRQEVRLPERIAALDMVHFEAWSLDWIEQVVSGKLSGPERQTKLMRINWYQMGQVAAERLLAKLEGDESSGQAARLAPRLVHVIGEEEQPISG